MKFTCSRFGFTHRELKCDLSTFLSDCTESESDIRNICRDHYMLGIIMQQMIIVKRRKKFESTFATTRSCATNMAKRHILNDFVHVLLPALAQPHCIM